LELAVAIEFNKSEIDEFDCAVLRSYRMPASRRPSNNVDFALSRFLSAVRWAFVGVSSRIVRKSSRCL